MDEKQIEKLKKLAKIFNVNNVVTVSDIEKFLKQISSTINDANTNFEKVSLEQISQIQEVIDFIKIKYPEILKSLSEKESSFIDTFTTKLYELDRKIEEVKSIKTTIPKDGHTPSKDELTAIIEPLIPEPIQPDISSIVSDVLSKVPEYKIDTGVDIKNKLEELRGDNRLDISSIKGSEKIPKQENIDKAISILDQRTQFLINKQTTSSSGGSGITSLNGLTGATQTFATDNPTSGASIFSVASSGTTHTFSLVGKTVVHPTVGSTFLYGEYNPTMGGGYSTAYGVNALSSSTIGIYNVAISGDALKNATDATGVIAIGFETAKSVVAGAANSIVIGTSNASLATSLSTSTLIGTRLATSASGVVSVIGVGDLMFQNITSSAINNLGIGFNLFNSITTDQGNYGVGKDIGDAATGITATYSFGEALFRNATSVSSGFAFGTNLFNNLSSGSNFFGFGASNATGAGAVVIDSFLIGSGIANTGASFIDGSILIGLSVVGNNPDPYVSSCIIFGKNAGLNGTSLVNEVYIGEGAGGNSLDGTGNTCIAAASGFGIVHGQNNVYVGYQTGYTYDGSGNVANGLGSMYSWNGSYNVFSGTLAGNFGAGDYITGLGYSAFATASVVTRSVAVGAYAGSTYSTDVTDVVLVGYGTEASATNATNELDFGSETSALTHVYLGWGGLASTAPSGNSVTIEPTASTAGTTGADLILRGGNDTTRGKVIVNSIFETQSGRKQAIRVVTATGAVTVTSADDIVVVNKGTGAATTVNLPAGVTGTVFTIKDGKGDAATNNITVTPAAGNIDGAGTFVMNNNYQSVSLVYNGTEWNII